MPRERMSMRKIREVLRLKQENGLSVRAIAAACQLGRSTVQEYLQRSESAGLGWPLPQDLGDDELETRLFPLQGVARTGQESPDMERVTRELRRKGVTLVLLWEEYRRSHPDGYGYSRFCDLYREHAGQLDPRMRFAHKAGEKLFVDYAGMTMEVVERGTGEALTAQIFVATLGASDYTFAEATWTQTLEDWIGSHVRAFHFFGGCPEILVPDNLKSGITKAHRYEPEPNRSYAEMAKHYGVAIIPARVLKPRDKAKVEVHVQHVERRVLAPLRDRVFFSLEELNQALAPLMEELNHRRFQKLAGTRHQLFVELEQPALGALPVEAYEFAVWSTARVNIDYHVEVDHGFYSVPYTLLKQQVDVRLTARVVEIFLRHQRVASHVRCGQRGRHITTAEHMPEAHRTYLEWTPERLVRWASENGPATAEVVTEIMGRHVHPQQGFRSCLGVMRLGQEFGPERLEAACRRALAIRSPTYKSIQSILKSKLDQVAFPGIPSTNSPSHRPSPAKPSLKRPDPEPGLSTQLASTQLASTQLASTYYGKPH